MSQDNYTVIWTFTVDKSLLNDPNSPLEAAQHAWAARTNEDSIANSFEVVDDETAARYLVDLSEDHPRARKRRSKK